MDAYSLSLVLMKDEESLTDRELESRMRSIEGALRSLTVQLNV